MVVRKQPLLKRGVVIIDYEHVEPNVALTVNPFPQRESRKSISTSPILFSSSALTTTLKFSLSNTLSSSFGSSRANPKDGPPQPKPAIYTRIAASLCFSSNN